MQWRPWWFQTTSAEFTSGVPVRDVASEAVTGEGLS